MGGGVTEHPFKLVLGQGTIADATDEMTHRILEVVCEYAGRLHVATALGVLDIVKASIIDDAMGE